MMADVTLYESPLSPTPPPPVYTQRPFRSASPRVFIQSKDRHEVNASSFQVNQNHASTEQTMQKSSSRIPKENLQESRRRFAPSAVSRVLSPTDQSLIRPWSFSSEEQVARASPAVAPPETPRHDSLLPKTLKNQPPPLYHHKSGLKSPARNQHPCEHPLPSPPPCESPSDDIQSVDVFHQDPLRQIEISNSDNISQPVLYEPLQYHHEAFDEIEMGAINKRTSKLTMRSNHSSGSSQSDSLFRTERLPTSDFQGNIYGRALRRPDSGFSSTSDLRGRTRSPQISPNTRQRHTSANSKSPETGPYSHVDLLNVPYPQAPPSGAEQLVNAQLRTSVGNNASLLSIRQTLEMYRANVKKTNDPAIQYEFAVFMISAAQDAKLEDGDMSVSAFSDKSQGSVQSCLLKEARNILQRLADRSYPFAQYYLADGFASGLFNKGKEDYDRAFPLFLAASKHGHAEAGYRTALCHEFGWGCRIDGAKAVQFYQHAASKNHPGAMLRLGRGCLMGDMGLGRRYREGIRWLNRAAESADFQYNSAPYELGLLHESGFGDDIFRDESYAAQLFTKSADLGHAEANFRLGEAYEFGSLNCPKDPRLSIHFYTGAAQQGHPLAQLGLCAWYLVGVPPDLEQDHSEAYEWARRAAESGLAKAEFTLGYFTEMGIGCRRDPLEANVWYVQAADHGDERAKARIQVIRDASSVTDTSNPGPRKKGMLLPSTSGANMGPSWSSPARFENDRREDGEKAKKKFGLF